MTGNRAVISTTESTTPRLSIGGVDIANDFYRFRRAPGYTAHSLLSNAVIAARTNAQLLPFQRLILSLMPSTQLRAIAAMAHVGATYAPGVAVPEEIDTVSSRAASDAIAGADPRSVEASLVCYFGAEMPDRWAMVLDSPNRWLSEVAGAHRSVAAVIGEVWRRAQARVSLEQYKFDLSLSAATDMRPFVNSSLPYELDGDVLSMPHPLKQRFHIPQPLLVAPIVSIQHRPLLLSRMSFTAAGYPVDVRTHARRNVAAQDRLLTLLGTARCAILLSAHLPVTMGELARLLHYAPSTLTHHATVLQRSGLLDIRRDGVNVYASRTPAGEILLDLLSS